MRSSEGLTLCLLWIWTLFSCGKLQGFQDFQEDSFLQLQDNLQEDHFNLQDGDFNSKIDGNKEPSSIQFYESLSKTRKNNAGLVRDGILERVPPSRPAPKWDKPHSRPSFENNTRTRVVTAVGNSAFLHCRIKHLGDRTVTWIRKKDIHVLTVGLFTYTTDDRFTALHSEGSHNWTLRIASPQISDSGTFECQVSIEPKISKKFTLRVIESQAHIEGPKEIHMVSNSNINLTCKVTGGIADAPQHMYWYVGRTLINTSDRGGISIVTDKHSRVSQLVVTRATAADSGNYSCAPANARPAFVVIYILNGEHPEAMQGGCAFSNQHFLYLKLLSLLLLKFYYSFSDR